MSFVNNFSFILECLINFIIKQTDFLSKIKKTTNKEKEKPEKILFTKHLIKMTAEHFSLTHYCIS